MKKLAFALIFSIGSIASAQQSDSERLYKFFDVSESNITPAQIVGSSLFEKSLGGLVCQKSAAVVPNPVSNYSCFLAIEKRNDGAIYNRLKIAAKNTTPRGLVGNATWEKAFGKFVCQKRQVVARNPRPTYRCFIR